MPGVRSGMWVVQIEFTDALVESFRKTDRRRMGRLQRIASDDAEQRTALISGSLTKLTFDVEILMKLLQMFSEPHCSKTAA